MAVLSLVGVLLVDLDDCLLSLVVLVLFGEDSALLIMLNELSPVTADTVVFTASDTRDSGRLVLDLTGDR